MKKNQLEIDGIVVEIIRKPIKNIHLRIYPPDGQVKVSVPLRLHLDLIYRQLSAKSDWIHHQRARLKTQPTQPSFKWETGEQHYFLGKIHTLIIHETETRKRVSIDDKFIHCFVNINTTPAEKKALLQNWYRQQMKTLLPALIEKWESIIGVKINAWGIKIMKTRWGSCNTRAQRIWLNLYLVKKPLVCLEYVLVHELVHLLEANHNKRFYALMDRFMPAWRNYQKLLETNI